jgi:hypothetical protein
MVVYFNRFEWVKCQILKLNQISSWNLEIGKYPWNCKMSIKLSFPLVCSIKCDDVTNKERCGLIMCIELWCIITRGNLTWLILDVIWRLACNLRITMTYIPLLCQLKITYYYDMLSIVYVVFPLQVRITFSNRGYFVLFSNFQGDFVYKL